jgi:hypothetical protein
MRRVAIVTSLILVSAIAAQAQKSSPSDTVVKFYRALKDKKYVEGFRYSVYRGAIEGLSAADLKDLEPDFARTFSEIPEKIEVKGEQISGDTAVVFLKFSGSEETQPVAVLRINGEWQVGDKESLALVQQQGRSFFFNSRMTVNEQEVVNIISHIFGAEIIYSQKFNGQYLNLVELVNMQAVSKDVEDGEANGYKFTMTVGSDKKSFTLTAVPDMYGKTGKLSFYLDPQGLRAEDLQGRPATDKSPLFQPKQD